MTRYVKFISTEQIENAPVNYTDGKSTICNFNKAPEIMLKYGYKPLVEAEREAGKEYKVTYKEQKTQIKEVLKEIVPDPEEEARKERERLDRLTLTPADVERALYYGLGMDFDDLKALIGTAAPTVDLKALAIEFRANDFYRGAVDKNGNRLVDMIGVLLGLTTDELDYLFQNKELPRGAIDRLNPPETTEEEPVIVEEENPEPTGEEETPVEEENPEPTGEEETPIVEEETPVAEEETPVVEEETPEPTGEEETPTGEEETPVEEPAE